MTLPPITAVRLQDDDGQRFVRARFDSWPLDHIWRESQFVPGPELGIPPHEVLQAPNGARTLCGIWIEADQGLVLHATKLEDCFNCLRSVRRLGLRCICRRWDCVECRDQFARAWEQAS